MPRAIVGPGSRSKRSCSSDSIWRGANLSCCATSSTASPDASRAAFSSAPIPVSSVKFSPLQRLVFGRARVAPAQLRRVALLRDARARATFDLEREPQRLRARIRQLVVARNQPARLLHLPLLVTDLAQIEQCRGLVGLHLQGALEELLGVFR